MERGTSGNGVSTHAPGANLASCGRVLVVEPDELTRWSLRTYLQRYFTVEALAAGAAAEASLRARPVTAVVFSDELTAPEAEALAAAARQANPDVRIVLMTAEDSQARELALRALRVEKPFALEDLARVLGVAAK